MAEEKLIEAAAPEGRRERKRRQTRERIEQAAMALFLERGFDATTIEDITEAADVSKRSFFDYFPSKEEVVFAWQDSFAYHLMAAIAARPKTESSVAAVEQALVATVIASADERGLALGELIQRTPALKARDQLKYAKLETDRSALRPRRRQPQEQVAHAAAIGNRHRHVAGRWRALEGKAARFIAGIICQADLCRSLEDAGRIR
jgi:AcrR family transcriptional regulator